MKLSLLNIRAEIVSDEFENKTLAYKSRTIQMTVENIRITQ